MNVFDLSVYYPIPLLSTEGYVSLTKTLVEVAPNAPPGHVKLSMEQLLGVLALVDAGLISRIDEDLSTRLERAYDIFVDGVWFELRDRLAFYECFKHEGTAMFSEEERDELEFDERLEQGRTAAMIHSRIFGDGADFLRDRYPEQATHMATRLNWVESKQLEDQLTDLVTPQFVTLLKVCQRRYESMVNDRSSRVGKSIADLRELRNKLRTQIYGYVGAVGSMYDGTPETAEIIEKALRPILIARSQSRRKTIDALLAGNGQVGEENEQQLDEEQQLEGQEPDSEDQPDAGDNE